MENDDDTQAPPILAKQISHVKSHEPLQIGVPPDGAVHGAHADPQWSGS